MSFVMIMAAAAAAVAIEMLEALAIVLAVGMARGFRDALLGALAAVVGVVLLCLALGPALLAGTDLHVVRVIVGTLLLLFGLEWLRKGILRMANRRRRSSSHDEFLEQRDGARTTSGSRGGAGLGGAGWSSFKGVFLEGLEVGLIVLALGGSARPADAGPARRGTRARARRGDRSRDAAAAQARLPETQLKLGVGVALTAFGTFFIAEGLHVEWPLGDVALVYLAGLFAVHPGSRPSG